MATEVLGDERSLRTGRRERALAQMEAHDLDILILGRQSNIRYVSGAQQLWVAGTRPFAPSCVLLRNGAVHLLSTWDEGVPEDIPHENLYGIAWNPMNTIENLRKIPGAATARRVGSDALSPGFAQLLPMAFPNAELVDGEPAIRAARRIKTAEEIATLRESVRVAEVGLVEGDVPRDVQLERPFLVGGKAVDVLKGRELVARRVEEIGLAGQDVVGGRVEVGVVELDGHGARGAEVLLEAGRVLGTELMFLGM